MDGVICAIFWALIIVAAELGVEKILMHMRQKDISSKKVLLIMRREIF